MKIGLFDSGIGGLNVLKEFLKKYPQNEYYYYGDTKNIPYGNKDKDTLLKLSLKAIHFFEQKQVDLIVIACGTVSSNCYLELKKQTKIPIFDIISSTIAYVNSKTFQNILVFGTERTIESHIFKNNLKGMTTEIKTPEFVPMIENLQIDSKIIAKYLKNFQDIDCLILGCTHYPILKAKFLKYLPSNVEIIDMGECLVNKISLEDSNKQSVNLYFTKISDSLLKNIKKILDCNYSLNNIE